MKANFWTVGLLFLLFVAPFSLGALFVAPSEMFYTDAAIRMIGSGDYFTPYFDEDLRFQKPILTYWWVVAAFQLFGVDYWTSRLPFLLGGLALLWVTYRISLLISPNQKPKAALSALVLATHPLLILSASRAMPDLPLVLFTTWGAYGALGMLRSRGEKTQYAYQFYLAFALSVATKGIPGLILCALTALFMLVNPFMRLSWKRVFSPFPLMLGLLVAFGWYAYMYQLHREVFLNEFFNDQVGGRVIEQAHRFWVNIRRYLITLLYAAPFLVLALWRRKKLRGWFSERAPEEKALVGIFMVWLAFFTITAPFFLIFYDRYIFSLIPLQAVLIAGVLLDLPLPKTDRWGQWLAAGLYSFTLLGLPAAFIAFWQHWVVWVGLALNGVLGFVFRQLRRWPVQERILWRTALALLGIWLNLGIVLIPVVHPESEKQAADYLTAEYGAALADKNIILVEWKRAAAKFRIGADGRFSFRREEDWRKIAAIKPDNLLLVLPRRHLHLLDSLPNTYKTKPISLKYRRLYQTPFLRRFMGKPRRLYVAEPQKQK